MNMTREGNPTTGANVAESTLIHLSADSMRVPRSRLGQWRRLMPTGAGYVTLPSLGKRDW
jgi:hypothetical protein